MKDDRGPSIAAATIVTISMAFVLVAMRMASRVFILRHTTWDDYLIVISWLIAFGASFCVLLAIKHGFGLKDADIKPEWVIPSRKFGYIFSVLYNPALMTAKSSILIFYLRLSKTRQLFRLGIYGTLAVVNVIGLILTFLTIFQCRPVSKAFAGNPQSCIPVVTLYLAASPSNIFSDVAILVLPLPILIGMHLPTRQKTVLVATFGLGIFVIVADVIWIHYTQKIITFNPPNINSPQTGSGVTLPPDIVFEASFALMWGVIEVNISIVCACVPLTKPLVAKIMPKLIYPAFSHSAGTAPAEPQIPEVRRRPEQMPTQRPVQVGIEGFSPLDFRMPTPLGVERPISIGELGSPVLRGWQQSPVDATQGTEAPAQEHSDQNPISPAHEQVGSMQQSSHHISAAPAHGSETFTSGPQQTRTSPQRHREDSTQHLGQQAQGTMSAPEQSQQTEIDHMPDFITAPGMQSASEEESTLREANNANFGFININIPKSMLETTEKASWGYCSCISVALFLSGFSYGLLNSINIQISIIARYTQAMAVSIPTVYFSGYFFGPLTIGLYCLRRGGCKATLIVGLCIYGTGTLVFWPSSILLAYPGFIVSNFIMGFGLSIVQTAANYFVTLCGPARYGESRLLAAQAIQGLGSVTSELMVEKGFFPRSARQSPGVSVRWTYLAISFFSVILALFFYYLPLPEASDSDLQDSTQARFLPVSRAIDTSRNRTNGWRVTSVSLFLACIAQFFYSFIRETFNLWFHNMLHSGDESGQRIILSADFVLIGHGAFAASALLSAIICIHVRPRFVLLGAIVGTAAFRLAFLLIPSGNVAGDATRELSAVTITAYIMEGPVYALIFALALRGLGARTKLGAALVTTMNAGRTVGPWVLFGVSRRVSPDRKPFIVGVILAFLTIGYPLYLCVVRRAREIADWHDDDAAEKERRRSQTDSVSGSEVTNRNMRAAENRPHWVDLVGEKFDSVRRASVTSGKAVGGWVISVREWTRRVSGFGEKH